MAGDHSEMFGVVNIVVKHEVTYLMKWTQAEQKNSPECRFYIILCIDAAKPLQKWMPSY